jgi:septal ring factor EnvC (AmiA/AmiB activator)
VTIIYDHLIFNFNIFCTINYEYFQRQDSAENKISELEKQLRLSDDERNNLTQQMKTSESKYQDIVGQLELTESRLRESFEKSSSLSKEMDMLKNHYDVQIQNLSIEMREITEVIIYTLSI